MIIEVLWLNFVITAPREEVSQKTHIAKKKNQNSREHKEPR